MAEHPILDQPATVEACARDYAAAKKASDARKTDTVGALADLRSLKPAVPHRR